MKVKVTRRDIQDGRADAGEQCGCPIWHALNRAFGICADSFTTKPLAVPNVDFARIGSLCIPLPAEAVDFQSILMKDPMAEVKPFSFEVEASTYFVPNRKNDAVSDVARASHKGRGGPR